VNDLRVRVTPSDIISTADTQQPPKRKMSDYPQLQRPPGSQLGRLPGRSDGRPLDADLILLSDILAQKENMLQTEMEEKAQQHRKWNQNHVDLTREPLSPVQGQGPDTGFRPATAQYQYLMTPPSSVTSESFDQHSPSQEIQENPEPFTFRSLSPPPEDEPQGQPAYRRRIGRCGRLWIDRRGMSSAIKVVDDGASDRWKYDQDDDDEQPIYELKQARSLAFPTSLYAPSGALVHHHTSCHASFGDLPFAFEALPGSRPVKVEHVRYNSPKEPRR